MLRGKTIFITGGAGFIGTHLSRRLAPHNKLVLFDNLYRNAFALAPDLQKHPNITFIKGDVLNQDSVLAALSAHRPDIIIHMASIAGVQTVISQPVKVLKINILGTYNVLDAVLQLGLPIERFIDFSTSEVYGPHVFEADEEGHTSLGPLSQPRWYYAASKLASEYITHGFRVEHNLPTVSIRPFNVYGPLQIGEGAVHNFTKAALAHNNLIVHNNGGQIRSWCYIDDFVEGVVAAATRPEAIGHSFNLGNPRATVTNLHLAQLIVAAADSKSEMVFKKIDYPEITLRVPNIDKAERLLGFNPRIGIDEGVKRTVDWMRTIQLYE